MASLSLRGADGDERADDGWMDGCGLRAQGGGGAFADAASGGDVVHSVFRV